MKKTVVFVVTAYILVGCSSIEFYSDSSLKNETGIEFYQPKPYLLVEKFPTKDIPMRTSVIYLPDKSNPKFVKVNSGLGSSDLKMTLTNGMITSFGVISDSKITETLSAISETIASTGSSYKTIIEALNISDVEDETESEITDFMIGGNDSKFKKFKRSILFIVSDLKEIKKSEELTTNQKEIVESVSSKFDNLITEMGSSDNEDLNKKKQYFIDKYINIYNSLIPIKNDFSSSNSTLHTKLISILNELDRAIKLLFIAKSKVPSFDLYEIIITNNNTRFIKVN